MIWYNLKVIIRRLDEKGKREGVKVNVNKSKVLVLRGKEGSVY